MQLGPYGEKLAVKFVRRLGYRVILCNYQSVGGEIDLIAGDGDTLVFIEVKTRSSDDATYPEAAVNPAKQARIIRAAKYFIAESDAADVPARFDVIAIVVPPKGKPEIKHFINAFAPKRG